MPTRWILPALAFALLIASTSSAVAYHLSVGGQDSMLTQTTEAPGHPSVSGSLWRRGVQTDCYTAQGGLDHASEEILEGLAADPFCGELRYNPGTPFEQHSPPDQHVPVDRVTVDGRELAAFEFDVIATQYVGTYGTWTCLPWCHVPYGRTGYETGHALLHEAGLIGYEEDDAWQGDGGTQAYDASLHLPHASLAASDLAGWSDGDGWLYAGADTSFEGVLTAWQAGPGRVPVTQEDLDEIVADLQQAGALSPAAVPRVCGFTPDLELEDRGAGGPVCEVVFSWIGEADGTSGGDPRFDDPCASPAYLCGNNRPAWHAQVVCGAGLGMCRQADTPRLPDPDGIDPAARDPADLPVQGPERAGSTTSYEVWHFVVAPSPGPCDGRAEPGFGHGGWPLPYLAHDLDVYTPPEPTGVGDPVAALSTWGVAAGRAQVESTGALVDPWTRRAWWDDVPEPNGGTAGSFEDTSRRHVQVGREGDACLVLPGTPESPDQVDPWVDLLDNRLSTLAVGALLQGDLGLHGLEGPPDDGRRDASHRGGPTWVTAGGKVGLFTDVDDDGTYDQASWDRLWSGVKTAGAYPLFWDMWLDHDGQPDARRGCFPAEHGADPRQGHPPSVASSLPGLMDQAGYGPRTGLVQIVHLEQPTALLHRPSGMALAYPEAPTTFLFTSQAIDHLYADGDRSQADPWVLETIGQLTAAAATTTGSHDRSQVVVPREDLSRIGPPSVPDPLPEELGGWRPGPPKTLSPTDFAPQCGQPTGGFTSVWAFQLACPPGTACADGTVITAYLLEDGPQLPAEGPGGDAGTGWIGPLEVDGEPVELGDGTQLWVDVDPLGSTG